MSSCCAPHSRHGLEPCVAQAGLLLTRWSLASDRRVSSTHVPVPCSGTVVRRGVAVGVHYVGRIANDSLAGTPGAVFANTSFARFGDLGSHVLPPAPSGTIWKAGSSVEVTWGIRFNHGGGYSYRCVVIHISRFPTLSRFPLSRC